MGVKFDNWAHWLNGGDIQYVVKFSRAIGRLEIFVSMRSKNNAWGRFGGGWNWKLGLQAGGRTVVISFLIIEVMLSVKRKKV